MKKAAAAILLVIYVALSSGIVLSMHYCMDRLDSMQLGAVQSDTCNKCGMSVSEANGCCHDEVKVIKIQDEQQAASMGYNFDAPGIAIIITPGYTDDVLASKQIGGLTNNLSPPLHKQDTYLRNRVFRI